MCDFLETVETSPQGYREAEAYAWGVAVRAARGSAFGLGGRGSGIWCGGVILAASQRAVDALAREALADDARHYGRVMTAYGHGVHGDTFDTLPPCDCGECYWNRQEA